MKKVITGITCFLFILITIFYISILKQHDLYYEEYLKKTNNIISFGNPPRGDIYDVNHKLLVRSVKVRNVAYAYIKRTNQIEIAEALAQYSNFNNIDDAVMNDYSNNKYGKLVKLSALETQAAYIYYLMNNGKRFEYKIIFTDVTSETLDQILSLNLPGVVSYDTYRRYYYYDTYFNDIIGTVGKIKKEDIDDYLTNGYALSDEVGISYLEEAYEPYLKGSKAIYRINEDNSLTKLKDEAKGADLILNIDIDLQRDIEADLKHKILELKQLKNTEYYHTSYVIVSNPNTGGIIAMAGVNLINNDYKTPLYSNKTIDILTKSYVMGSVIKGASQSVAYKYDVINRGKYIKDSCVKLYSLNPKCSFKDLGNINDITALKYSSNYYQFINAIKVSGNTYKNNMKLRVTEADFFKYRNMFKEYGLGTTTGIDVMEYVPKSGNIIAPDLLLNLSIGQYDPYTPISLTQYINTIANGGNRYKLNIVKEAIMDDQVILNNNGILLNKVSINLDDLKRIQEGFREVLDHGTGWGYINLAYKPAGKTGTSETFMDSDGDLKDDLKTITETSAMYFPYDNPKYSIVIISPNSSHYLGKTDYIAPINSKISKKLTKNMFENY